MTTHHQARFAPLAETPIDPATARLMATEITERQAQLAQFVADLCETVDTLWTDNERLQAGIDRNLELVAAYRGKLGTRLAPGVLDRLGESLRFGVASRCLATPIDITDLNALVEFFRSISEEPS